MAISHVTYHAIRQGIQQDLMEGVRTRLHDLLDGNLIVQLGAVPHHSDEKRISITTAEENTVKTNDQ